jgi:hypothetical protein
MNVFCLYSVEMTKSNAPKNKTKKHKHTQTLAFSINYFVSINNDSVFVFKKKVRFFFKALFYILIITFTQQIKIPTTSMTIMY